MRLRSAKDEQLIAGGGVGERDVDQADGHAELGGHVGVLLPKAGYRLGHQPLRLVLPEVEVAADPAHLVDAVEDGEVAVAFRGELEGQLDGENEPVDTLVELSRDASVVVLQHRMLGPVHRAFSGSMVNGVAARALSPVVSVGESWRPREPRGVVTVAVQEPDDALDMLSAASEEANARGASVNLLHAWWLSSGYDVVVADDAYRKERELEARVWLDPVLAEFEDLHTGTTVTTQIRHAPPLEAILDAAATSDLLVLGRRRRVLPQGSHLGPVSRAVLDHTDTPVLVIGKRTAERV